MKNIFTILLTLVATSVFAQVDLTKDLVAFYPFNTNALDESSNSNDGVVYGASLTKDRFGNDNSAYQFTGDSRIVCPLLVDGTTDFSISLWVKSSKDPSEGYIIYNGDVPSGTSFAIAEIGNTGGCNATANQQDLVEFLISGKTCFALNSTYKLTLNTWTHLVIIKSGSNLYMYVDGDLEASSTPPALAKAVKNTIIGKPHTDYPAPSIIGDLDDIRFYSRAINTSEVSALYNDKSTSSIGNVNIAAQVSVYPNPSNGTFTVKLPNQGANLTLVNAQGVTVKQFNNFNQTTLQLADLPKGMYILQAKIDGYNAYQKIIIQ